MLISVTFKHKDEESLLKVDLSGKCVKFSIDKGTSVSIEEDDLTTLTELISEFDYD